jgi:exosome complex RNA-binding protein Csl4
MDTPTDMTAQIQKYGDTYALVMYINGTEYGVAIEYCPQCGRRLAEEE